MNLGVQTIDEPIEPGQYRYIATRAWWMASFGSRRTSYAYLAEHLMREWVPAEAGTAVHRATVGTIGAMPTSG